MEKALKLQLKLFAEIEKIVGKSNLPKSITEKLNQTPSCVYRKLKLERLLSTDEIILLAKDYGLSLDKLIAD